MIPRIVHRWWQGEPSPMEPWLHHVIKSLNPGWEIIDHDEDPTDFVPGQVKPEDLIRHKSNVFRYQIMRDVGGVWMDNDLVPLAPFDDLINLGPVTAALGQQREGCFLMFPPNHPLMDELLRFISVAPDGLLRRSADVSGAQALTFMGAQHRDVGFETRVVPFDAAGQRTPVDRPIAVHLWTTSAQRFNLPRI